MAKTKHLGPLRIFKDISRDFASHRIVQSNKELHRLLAGLHQMEAMNYVEKILEAPRYSDPLRVQKHGFKAFSQFDEDGIIEEILRRVGVQSRRFIEIGVGNGLENNTLYLFTQGWRGLWLDANPTNAKSIGRKFKTAIAGGRLTFQEKYVDRDNVNAVIEECGYKGEIDVLSIDVDGNDYHLWEAIDIVSPRLVVIEYNVKFRPPVEWVMEYNPKHMSDKTDYFGASLKAFELLGRRKGYGLVGCGLTGANSYFVREDLLEDKFLAPYTAETHYEPCRYILAWQYRSGMAPNYGSYIGKGGKRYD